MRCLGCNLKPGEIDEYVHEAQNTGTTPEDFVWKEEGTLNRFTGEFFCTECYIKIGMPLIKDMPHMRNSGFMAFSEPKKGE